jgi:hypothetical protein
MYVVALFRCLFNFLVNIFYLLEIRRSMRYYTNELVVYLYTIFPADVILCKKNMKK